MNRQYAAAPFAPPLLGIVNVAVFPLPLASVAPVTRLVQVYVVR